MSPLCFMVRKLISVTFHAQSTWFAFSDSVPILHNFTGLLSLSALPLPFSSYPCSPVTIIPLCSFHNTNSSTEGVCESCWPVSVLPFTPRPVTFHTFTALVKSQRGRNASFFSSGMHLPSFQFLFCSSCLIFLNSLDISSKLSWEK